MTHYFRLIFKVVHNNAQQRTIAHNSAQYREGNSTQHLIIATFIGAVSRTAQGYILHKYWTCVHKSTPVLSKSSRVESIRYGVIYVVILTTIYSLYRKNIAIIMHLYIQYIEYQCESKIRYAI